MEEREALKRQIELLQNLINNHKSIHGDSPSVTDDQSYPECSTSTRGRGRGTFARGRPYTPQSRGSWRKTYSLRNKNPQSSVGRSLASTPSSVDQSSSQGLSHTTSLPSCSRAQQNDETKTATLLSENASQKKEGHTSIVTGIGDNAAKETTMHAACKRREDVAVSQHGGGKGRVSSLASAGVQQAKLHRQAQEIHQKPESSYVRLGKRVTGSSEVPSVFEVNTSTSLQSSSQVQIKPSLTSRTSTDSKQATTQLILTGKITSLPPMSKVSTQPSLIPPFQKSQVQAGASYLKQSNFTWVKSQNMEGVQPRHGSLISSNTAVTVAPTPNISKPGVASGSYPSFTINKRTPAKKLPRKLSMTSVTPKTSKYKWVSFSAGAQAKAPRKPLSPKALILAQRAFEKGETSAKLKPSPTLSAKIKKGTSSSLSSRYCWKAGGQGTTAAVMGGATVARRRSAFYWTSEKGNKGVKGGLVVSPSLPQRASLPSSSPGGFKLRSRMKIIRRSASSGCGTEKANAPLAVKYSPRSRIHPSARSPMGIRRTTTRELVSFGRHKLRRLSPALSGTSPTSPSHRLQVFRTRYKIVTRPGCTAAHALHYNPALSWRTRKIQSARTFLQSRCRVHQDRNLPSSQHWRGSSMCWIRGSLYRVSANKLSRTATSSMSINRTGRSSSHQVWSPTMHRHSSNRHLASRAVQRSLAIIRQARQKKQQRQYCMYYNRFGKCNRGSSCPYVHDPDKVAVCTRFLRGTCKQADGACPFSHKVAKEKMPVCSYFLRGICNNSDCPYSHVYVSRKAEVCKDFVNGYCPEGEKCKKKHTLVCPDFSKTGSCPQGARCKLQHRQRAKRSDNNTSTAPAKKTRTKEATKRPSLSVAMPQGSPATPQTPPARPLELPSFISLSSSPEEADTPDVLPVENSKVKEKKLQIKPRL